MKDLAGIAPAKSSKNKIQSEPRPRSVGTTAMLSRHSALNLFKVFSAVFTERTDEVRRQFIAFINISADLADIEMCIRDRIQS